MIEALYIWNFLTTRHLNSRKMIRNSTSNQAIVPPMFINRNGGILFLSTIDFPRDVDCRYESLVYRALCLNSFFHTRNLENNIDIEIMKKTNQALINSKPSAKSSSGIISQEEGKTKKNSDNTRYDCLLLHLYTHFHTDKYPSVRIHKHQKKNWGFLRQVLILQYDVRLEYFFLR